MPDRNKLYRIIVHRESPTLVQIWKLKGVWAWHRVAEQPDRNQTNNVEIKSSTHVKDRENVKGIELGGNGKDIINISKKGSNVLDRKILI